MLLGGSTNSIKRYSEQFEEQYIKNMEYCVSLMLCQQYKEAWSLLNTFERESIPLLFNKAVFLFCTTDKSETALPMLERVWMLLTPMREGLKIQDSPILECIHEKQNNSFSYRSPVTFHYVDLFPQILKESVLRMMVDCYSSLGNDAKVLEIGTPLKSKGYRNVIEALDKINYKK